MSARKIIDQVIREDALALTRERQDELYDEVVDALNGCKVHRGCNQVVVTTADAAEAQYVAHVASGLCMSQFEQTQDGQIRVKLTVHRKTPADISLWATTPDRGTE